MDFILLKHPRKAFLMWLYIWLHQDVEAVLWLGRMSGEIFLSHYFRNSSEPKKWEDGTHDKMKNRNVKENKWWKPSAACFSVIEILSVRKTPSSLNDSPAHLFSHHFPRDARNICITFTWLNSSMLPQSRLPQLILIPGMPIMLCKTEVLVASAFSESIVDGLFQLYNLYLFWRDCCNYVTHEFHRTNRWQWFESSSPPLPCLIPTMHIK